MIENGRTISTGLFLRSLKKLNKEFRVCSFDNSNRLAGLYLINRQGEWEDICGVDKKYVPAYATFDDKGHIVKSGWRRVFWILYGAKYVTKQQIESVCAGFFDSLACKSDRFTGGVTGDPIANKLEKFALENFNSDSELLTTDQIVEVAQDIRAKDSAQLKEERAHDTWFLEKWRQQGGGVTDRPNY